MPDLVCGGLRRILKYDLCKGAINIFHVKLKEFKTENLIESKNRTLKVLDLSLKHVNIYVTKQTEST